MLHNIKYKRVNCSSGAKNSLLFFLPFRYDFIFSLADAPFFVPLYISAIHKVRAVHIRLVRNGRKIVEIQLAALAFALL